MGLKRVFKQSSNFWFKSPEGRKTRKGPQEESKIEYGWENPKEERVSFKDVEGQGRDDNL